MASAAELIAAHIGDLRAGRSEPLLVGLCGAQGSGKSTIAAQVVERLAGLGVSAGVLSLDDFYLTKAERLGLAQTVHPLLAVRGPPGTHDIGALCDTLDRLSQGEPAPSPTFDKLADDRVPKAFDRMARPADVILLEGWCIGAEPETTAQLVEPVNALERMSDAGGRWRNFVNEALAGPYRALCKRLNALVFLRAPNFEVVTIWRTEQERGARSLSGAGAAMSRDEIAAFVQHYERITRRMLTTPPRAVTLTIGLDADRRVVDAAASPASRRERR